MTSAILGGGKLFSDVTASSVEPIAEEGNRTYGVQMNSSDFQRVLMIPNEF